MTHPSVEGDKLNNKQQKKSLTRGGLAQLAKNMPQEEHTLSDRGGLKSAVHDPKAKIVPEIKGFCPQVKLHAKLIGSQEAQSIGQIIFPQPAILCGIIPSLAGLVCSPASWIFMGHNPFNLILLVNTWKNRTQGPLLGPNI